ncbi:MAG: cytochrome c [Proteobacteria bacterium]|nr:cytochrome c [Pseudomonadota bacterium]
MEIRGFAACCAIVLLFGSAAIAKPFKYDLPDETATLRPAPGPGREAAQNNCMSCHSADYVAMQPGKKGKVFWDAEVAKMVNVFKAQIAPGDMKLIGEYLAENY